MTGSEARNLLLALNDGYSLMGSIDLESEPLLNNTPARKILKK